MTRQHEHAIGEKVTLKLRDEQVEMVVVDNSCGRCAYRGLGHATPGCLVLACKSRERMDGHNINYVLANPDDA